MCESVHKCVHSFCFCFLLYFFLGGGEGGGVVKTWYMRVFVVFRMQGL